MNHLKRKAIPKDEVLTFVNNCIRFGLLANHCFVMQNENNILFISFLYFHLFYKSSNVLYIIFLLVCIPILLKLSIDFIFYFLIINLKRIVILYDFG